MSDADQTSTTLKLPRPVAAALRAVIRKRLRVSLARFPLLAVSFLALAWLLQAVADRYMRLSLPARSVLLLLDTLVVAGLFWFYVIGSLRRKLDQRAAALLVEREMPEFNSALVSAVDFCKPQADLPAHGRAIARRHLEIVAERVGRKDLAGAVIPTKPLRRKQWLAAAALALLIGSVFLAGLPLSGLLARRVLLSSVAFPAETMVEALSGDLLLEPGADASLAAKLSGKIPPSATLVIVDATGRETRIPVPRARGEAEPVFRYVVRNVRDSFRYHFEANDGTGPEATVKIKIPPVLKEMHFVQEYPAYTGLPPAEMSAGALRLLEGSKLKLEGTVSQELKSARLVIGGMPKPLWLEMDTAAGGKITKSLKVQDKGWKSMSVQFETTDGTPSTKEPVWPVEIISDKPPELALTLPKNDRITVVPGSKVDFAYRIADDFAIANARIGIRVVRGATGNAPTEEKALPVELPRGSKSLVRDQVLDLAQLQPPITAGCTIELWVEATDNNSLTGPGKGRSRSKVIAVVSEEEKRLELLELIGQRAKDVERLYERQRGIRPQNPQNQR